MRRTTDAASDGLGTDDVNLNIFDIASEEICFLAHSKNYCVCFVDIVNSTKVTAEITERQKIGQYYSIFINTMAILAKNHGAKIVKNAGDALILYFPETSDSNNETAFKDAFECFTTMTLARDIINAKMRSENLPSVSYRISADYGRVEVAKSTSSKTEDLFGSTMNICAKINSMAEPNGIVIGGDLCHFIKSFSFIDEYHFRELREGYSAGLGHRYPIYATFSKNISSIDISYINQLFRPTETSNIKGTQLHQQSQLFQQSQKKKVQKCSANIMIVDDEPDTLFTYKSILSEEGYNVQGFTDSKEALTHFVQLTDPSSYYHIVLLDIRMPELNGLQLFSRIKAVSPATKVMFASALDIAEELISILPNITNKDIMKKPMERGYLVHKVNSALNSDTPHFGSLSA